MSGIEPPREPVAPAPLVYPLTVPPRQTSWVPGIVGLSIFVLLGTIAAGIVMSVTAAGLADSSDLAAAQRVVVSLDDAYRAGDCEVFEAVTTDDVRQQILGKNYDCAAFEAAAEALTDRGEYAYAVDVLRAAKFDETVVVYTREAYGDERAERYTYLLENEGDGWLIADYGRD
jgi:ketosteroid isomerase-like protein